MLQDLVVITGAVMTGLLLLWCSPAIAHAQDKSGVKPQVISLPSGPGSLEGLGETFEPDLSSGTSSFPVHFTAAPGRGFQPELTLSYNGGNANGPWGMGWKINIPAIQRRTEAGLPSYDDGKDQFIYSNGEKLVSLTDGTYRFENEGPFMRFRRLDGGGWEAHAPDGMRYLFGEDPASRVTNVQGIFRWELSRIIDTHGNEQRYSYLHDGGNLYPREIRYNAGQQGSYNAVIFNYLPRPDTYTDRRSGAPIRVGLRGADIQMWALGKLVRLYRFAYEPEPPEPSGRGNYSLLASVTQVGDDGTSTLPPHTFTYTQFDPTAHAVVAMQNPPPVALTNQDADLVDINADGLPDLVYTPEDGQHRFYLNRGHGRWAATPLLPTNSPAERLSNPNVRMADMNGDGRVDLLVKASGTGAPLYYYRNQPGTDWAKEDRVDFGTAPAFDLNDPNLQLLDVNNDHRIDVVLATGGRLKIWLARETVWSQRADFDVPAPVGGSAAGFVDPKVKVGDMTGDRMEDLLFVRDGQVVLWAHNGNGDYDEGQAILNPPTGMGAADAAIQMGDLNNDGQVDLVLPGNRQVTYWLSLGTGSLTDPIIIPNTPAYDAQHTAVRLADIDGDGATELLFSSQNGMDYVDFSVNEQPFLLRTVDNGLGRTLHITYKSSIEDYIADWDANQPWAVRLPFPVQVVNQVTVHDANSGDDYTVDYHYRDGYYDGVQKEFRGFVRSEESKRGDQTAATTVTRLVYDVGMTDESRKGMVLEKVVLGEGGACAGSFQGCYQRTVNQLTTVVVVASGQTTTGNPIAYAYTSQTDHFVHEQQPQPVQLRQQFEQDRYGNVTKEFNFGQVCGDDVTCGDDELLTYRELIYDTDQWLLNRPLRLYQTDAAGNFVSESRFYYDGEPFVGLPLGLIATGDLIREEQNLGPNAGNRWLATKRYQVDPFGNQIGSMDGNGNRITVEYDPIARTFPVAEVRHFADGHTLTFAASYHAGFGKVTAATDYNGHALTYLFDTFGRISKIVQPGDTVALPTQAFRYEIGSPRSAIISEEREQSGTDQCLTTVVYFDGLGRRLQTRREAEGGQVVVTNAVTFNARQGVAAEYLPYYDQGLAYKAPDPALAQIRNVYDPLARLVRRQQPDGTFTREQFLPLRTVLYDEEDNTPTSPHYATPRTLAYDGLGRLTGVEEVNRVGGALERYRTRYAYDPLGYLLRSVDAQGNTKTQRFDALGRKLAIDDPDRGLTTFTYDDVGNVIEKVDAKGQRLHFTYDAANRILAQNYLTSENDTTPEVRYHYDAALAPAFADAQNTQGRLAWVEDETGSEYLSYDARGNLVSRVKRVLAPDTNAPIDFAMRMTYDAMERLVAYTYPDGTAQPFLYNAQSHLEAVPGYVTNLDYTASGKRSRLETADHTVTSYAYDARQRLAELRTIGPAEMVYQDWRYQLDGVSNVLRIDDRRPVHATVDDASQWFSYDSLYRLRTTELAQGDQIEFRYDAIGNLVEQASTMASQNLGVLGIGQDAGPHAVTQVGGASWRYDATGNLRQKPGFTYQWDFRNRLTTITSAAGLQQQQRYDYADRRITRWVRHGAASEVVLYPDRFFEVRGAQLIKYIFANDERIAEVHTPFDPSRLLRGLQDTLPPPTVPPTQTLFYHGDHLGSATLLVDAAGTLVEQRTYQPFGQVRTAQGVPTSAYGFTDKELDAASGLYFYGSRYYDPTIGRFISVDPLYLEQPEKALADPQALNLYAYAHNNPVRNIDPDGEDAVVVYGIGDDEAGNRKTANNLARDLRREHLRVTVYSAAELNKEKVQQKLANKPVSTAIFVGHGSTDALWLSSYTKPKAGQEDLTVTTEAFARMAGVRSGGVVGALACNVVTGYSASERALADRGISTIGFDHMIQIDDRQGLIQSGDRRVHLDPTGPALPLDGQSAETWVSPGAMQPSMHTGATPIQGGTFGTYAKAADERVNPRK